MSAALVGAALGCAAVATSIAECKILEAASWACPVARPPWLTRAATDEAAPAASIPAATSTRLTTASSSTT